MTGGLRIQIIEDHKKGGRLESLLVRTTQMTQEADVILDLQDQETLSMSIPELLRQAQIKADQIIAEDEVNAKSKLKEG